MASPLPNELDAATTSSPTATTPVTRADGIHPTIIAGSVFGGVGLLLAIGISSFCYRKRRRSVQRELPTVVVTCPTATTLASAPPNPRGERSLATSYIAPPGFATNPGVGTPGPGQYLAPGAQSGVHCH